jgi:hypothetical protein
VDRLARDEWAGRGRDASFLLRGSDLRGAEAWLSQQAGKEPRPTAVQTEYVLAARRAATRRQRVVLASVGAALAVALTLAVVALLQRNTAVAQRDRALSLALAAAARDNLTGDVGTSLLLSLEADPASATPQARQIAMRALETVRDSGVDAILLHPAIVDAGLRHRAFVQGVAFTPDGRALVTAADDGLRLWTLAPHHRRVRTVGDARRLTTVAVSPDGRVLASGGADGLVRLWDVRTAWGA